MHPDSNVIVGATEHQANLVPWQRLCQQTGATLHIAPITSTGTIDLAALASLIDEHTVLVAVNHISNIWGAINPIKEISGLAQKYQALLLVDGTQATRNIPVNFADLQCDFYVFSAHKMFGPTGVGVLYGRRSELEKMPPYQGGGEMRDKVSWEQTTFERLPFKFEAGTPNIAGGIGLGVAIDYIQSVGFDFIQKQEKELLEYATQELLKIDGLKIIGEAANKTCVISFIVEGVHPFDLGTIVDKMGVAVRTGHHCTQPLMDFFEIPGTTRASFSFYNTIEEVDSLVKALNRALGMLR